jgi:hypothetical protein
MDNAQKVSHFSVPSSVTTYAHPLITCISLKHHCSLTGTHLFRLFCLVTELNCKLRYCSYLLSH